MDRPEYDITIYGASGFTGRQAVAYFAQSKAAVKLRWAIAGRDRRKLEQIKASLGSIGSHLPILVADTGDQAAVDRIVANTRILANTAGPFALYGNSVVDACVRFKTHYVDITGETHWVKRLIDKYHDQAARDGTRIVPFCGFDSVPSDLGAYLMARHIQTHLGKECPSVRAYFRLRGGLNGGTVQTLFTLLETEGAEQTRNGFLLDATHSQSLQQLAEAKDPLLPFFDTGIGAWVGPFFMAPINTRVVRRSASLFKQWQQPYGSDFRYQEYLRFGGRWGWSRAITMTLAGLLFLGAVKSPLKRGIRSLLPKSGEGPTEAVMNHGWYRCDLLGTTDDGMRVHGTIEDHGDPGNRATVKFLCESALSLALDYRDLPGGSRRGGILTPATAFGDVLAKRLQGVGVKITIV